LPHGPAQQWAAHRLLPLFCLDPAQRWRWRQPLQLLQPCPAYA